jgi:hypothetical protein
MQHRPSIELHDMLSQGGSAVQIRSGLLVSTQLKGLVTGHGGRAFDHL